MSLDLKTPRNVPLTAFYKRSFAYHTVKNRMPVILTQVIDSLVRNKEGISNEFGEGSADDLKQAIGELSKLKYEIQTNKPLTPLDEASEENRLYNSHITKQASEDGETTHFNTIWLLTECYMYARIKDIFRHTTRLKDFDYFQSSKFEAYHKSRDLMVHLSEFIININNKVETCDKREKILKMLKLNLWGNKCDLSISLGKVDGPGKLHDTKELEQFVLVDDSENIYQALANSSITGQEEIDVVLDNSGYEVFTDLCMMDLVTSFSMAKKVNFHVKQIPWFISDVTEYDFNWTLNQLSQSDNSNMRKLGLKWKELVQNETWKIVVHPFWTLPFDFSYMKQYAPDLYNKLEMSKLIIFKGDLNYRKLFGDKNWDPITPPEEALQGFLPSRLCTLRTIKADIVVGLKPGVAEQCEKKDVKWMENGDYGLIQFVNKPTKS
ncbi:damage-control phosphatase ARMT1-like isoform X2 [Anthonomus grandis grandis]|nr:damage-control phosphatase ARMT1-like isoform X2 [Anthonomus grandis grandis]